MINLFFNKIIFWILPFAIYIIFGCNNNKIDDRNNILDSTKIEEWFNNEEWTNGFSILPDSSINKVEIYKQYNKNPEWWNKAFEFLKEQNLDSVNGFHRIDGDNVFAMVNIGYPRDKDDVDWESHKHYNDLQYIVSGNAGMGIIAKKDSRAKIKTPYDESKDIAFYNIVEETENDFFPSDSTSFFIFSPFEIHKPGFNISDSTNIVKRIIIKIKTGY